VWIIVVYGIASVLCFIAYAVDKSAAIGRRRRIPECTLLLLGALGGWPGALLAQQLLRHKTLKTAFLIAHWCTVAVNLTALLWLSYYVNPAIS
jgi:uncharacterized membrane protein YsdA (DUF1294 family)